MITIDDIKPGLPVTFVENPGYLPFVDRRFPDVPIVGRPMRLTGQWGGRDGEIQAEVRCMCAGDSEPWVGWMNVRNLGMLS